MDTTKLLEDNDRLQCTIASQGKELNIMRCNMDKLNKLIEEYEKDKDTLTTQVTSLSTKLRSMNDAFRDACFNNGSILKDKKEVENTYFNTQIEVDSLNSRIAELVSENSSYIKTIQLLNKKISKEKDKITTYKIEKEHIVQESIQLHAQFKAEIDLLQLKLQKAKDDTDKIIQSMDVYPLPAPIYT